MYRSRSAEQAQWLLQQFAQTSPGSFWMYTPDWSDLLFVSDAYETIWGRSIDDLVADPTDFIKGVHPDDRDSVTDAMADLSNGDPIELNFRVVPPGNADVRYVWCQGRPVYGDDDALVALAGYVRDVTEQTKHERRLEAFNRILSHDLQNQLQVAKGRLDIVLDGSENEHLRKVEQALDRMSEMTSDVLALPSPDQSTIEPTAVSLADLTRECWNESTEPEAVLVVDGNSQLTVDRSLFAHVFENLFQNAVEHTEGEVTVRVGPLPETSGLYVADDGEGISADERDAIFDVGHSQDSIGLGLTLVQEVVELHSGTITVTDSDGGGARFEIKHLPSG